ncbi:MAG TPA: hypothetical protein VLA12_20425 [Planctomycetaceae bacterium]|nr:hypothetical protein [Planctomycetaceae bacterium]
MSRKLFSLAMFVASFSLLLGTSKAEAKKYHVRNVNYHDCGHQQVQYVNYRDCGHRHVRHVNHHDCGCQRGCHVNYRDCGHQQVRHVNYRDCGHQQVYQVANSTCCAPRPSCAVPAVQASCATPQHLPATAPAPPPAY